MIQTAQNNAGDNSALTANALSVRFLLSGTADQPRHLTIVHRVLPYGSNKRRRGEREKGSRGWAEAYLSAERQAKEVARAVPD